MTMSKLDELLAEWDTPPAEKRKGVVAWAEDAAAELRRIQARERRYRELEARVREDGGGWFADTLRAIRGET